MYFYFLIYLDRWHHQLVAAFIAVLCIIQVIYTTCPRVCCRYNYDRLMLYTWLAVCIDKSKAVVTWLAVHVIISYSYLCMIYGTYFALIFFWISENGAKWNMIMKSITKHMKLQNRTKTSPCRDSDQENAALQYSELPAELLHWICGKQP